jgi:hypothetical protein
MEISDLISIGIGFAIYLSFIHRPLNRWLDRKFPL